MGTPRAFSAWMGLLAGCAAVLATTHAFAQPIARDDSYSTPAGTPLSIADPGVLTNDSAAAGGGLDASVVTNPSSGILFFAAGGGFYYIPGGNFTGNDTFTYQAREAGTTLSNVATVTITVVAPNVPPVAADDAYTTNEGQPLNVNASNGVLANDTDANSNPLTAVLVAGAASGTLALQTNGSFEYTPAAGFAGPVTFTYQANDGTASSNTATVTIIVNAVDDPPVAQADSYTTAEDTALSVAAPGVLGNDSDPEGAPLTAELMRNATNGVLQLRTDGSFTFAPDPNFNGSTTFTYRAGDGATQSGATTVTIAVTAVNDPPYQTNAPPLTVDEGVTYRFTLTAADDDKTTPTITAPTLPSWLTFTPPATISGTPGEADVGVHAVAMSITDGIAPAVPVQFQITVQNVDSPPAIAAIPEQTTTEGTPVDIDLAPYVTDSDTPATSLIYAATGVLPPGLALSAAGRLSGTPEPGASVGTHTVRFTVSDGKNPPVAGQLRVVVLPAGRVDLAVTMSASPNPVTLETPTTWTVTVTNRAPQVQAPGATLDVTFAGEVPFRFDAPSPTSGCTLAPNGDQNRFTCTLGPLAGGASTTILLTGRGSFAGDVFAQGTVKVTGGALDDTPGNDIGVASLSIAQSVAGVPAQRIALAGGRAIAAGDFNADGFDDLAVATASAQGVVVFTNVPDATNPGRRTFATPPQALGGEALTNDIAIADLDRDGDLDIVTAAGNGAPNRAFINSSGTFASASLGLATAESRAVAVGDVNGDAFVDLVFAGQGTTTVLLGTGSGPTFTPGSSVGPHDALGVLLVNLFGDALPELVLASGDPDGAAVYRNTGGAFTLETRLTTGPTSAVSTGDFNSDGRADLVFSRDTARLPTVPSALVWLNTSGSQMFVSDELGAATATRVLVRDFNLDKRSDVLALNGYGARIFTNAGAANGTFALHPRQLATPGARGVAAGKFSNDDRVDVAVVGESVSVFINDGSGNFGEQDANAPVIQLRGDTTVNLVIDSPYSDAGATATDNEDGDLTSRIVVTNPVNTTLLGTYTVTYNVSDLSGNAAKPVTRTVNVQPQAATLEGGGGGAAGLEMLITLLLVAVFAMPRERNERLLRTTASSDDPQRRAP
jgi:VCBS repeat-containing protein